MGTLLRSDQLLPNQVETPDLRYPTQLRIDFADPEIQAALYDLFDHLRMPPDVEQLQQTVNALKDRARELESAEADQLKSIQEWESEWEERDRDVHRLEGEKQALLKRLDGDTEVVALRTKAESWRSQSDSRRLELAALERKRSAELEALKQEHSTVLRAIKKKHQALEKEQQDAVAALNQEIERLKALNKELDW